MKTQEGGQIPLPKEDALKKARACIARLRASLLRPTPEALESHLPAFADVIQTLALGWKPGTIPGCEASGFTREDLRDLKALALELAICRKLIDHGNAMIAVLAGILAGANAGYSQRGAPPPLEPQNTVFLQG